MATQVHQFTVTVPANTTKAVPSTTDLTLDYVEIESLDIDVPPGPAGLMGFYVARSGQQVIPYESGEYIVWDDKFRTWPLTDQPTGSGWQLVGYNTDVFDHDVTLRFHTNPITQQSSPTPVQPLTVITSGVTASGAVL